MSIETIRPRFMRLKEVKELTGLSRSTIYEHMAKKNFPQAVKLGSHSVGWVDSEIHEWMNHIIDARDAGTSPF